MPTLVDRIVAAPISWGVCEVPGWGLQLPVERVLGEMADLGVTATEMGAVGWLPEGSDAVRSMLSRHDMTVIGGFVPLALHTEGAREVSRQTARSVAASMAAVGARYFVTAVVSDPDAWGRPEFGDTGWGHIVDGLAEIEEIVAREGLTQVLHPHADTLVETAAEVERVLAASPVALCLDTGHLFLGGADPVDIATRWSSRVQLVHLKDVDPAVAPRWTERTATWMEAVQAGLFPPLGDGCVPIAATIEALETAGYGGLYVIEQDIALTGGEPPVGEGPDRDVARSVAYLRNLDEQRRCAGEPDR